MKTYTFKVVVEPDEGGYHAYCPALRHLGAVTQGATETEALQDINEVVRMIVDELQEDGIALPTSSDNDVEVSGRSASSQPIAELDPCGVGLIPLLRAPTLRRPPLWQRRSD